MSCLSTSGSSKLTTNERPSVDSRKFELKKKAFFDVMLHRGMKTYIDFCLFTDFGAETGGDSMIRWS